MDRAGQTMCDAMRFIRGLTSRRRFRKKSQIERELEVNGEKGGRERERQREWLCNWRILPSIKLLLSPSTSLFLDFTSQGLRGINHRVFQFHFRFRRVSFYVSLFPRFSFFRYFARSSELRASGRSLSAFHLPYLMRFTEPNAVFHFAAIAVTIAQTHQIRAGRATLYTMACYQRNSVVEFCSLKIQECAKRISTFLDEFRICTDLVLTEFSIWFSLSIKYCFSIIVKLFQLFLL